VTEDVRGDDRNDRRLATVRTYVSRVEVFMGKIKERSQMNVSGSKVAGCEEISDLVRVETMSSSRGNSLLPVDNFETEIY